MRKQFHCLSPVVQLFPLSTWSRVGPLWYTIHTLTHFSDTHTQFHIHAHTHKQIHTCTYKNTISRSLTQYIHTNTQLNIYTHTHSQMFYKTKWWAVWGLHKIHLWCSSYCRQLLTTVTRKGFPMWEREREREREIKVPRLKEMYPPHDTRPLW